MKRLVLPLLLAVVVSCGSAPNIRDAQDNFSRAAAAENSAAAGVLVPGGIRADYRLALQAVQQELDNNEAKLRSDKLLGVALTLKAMCEWRLAYLEGTDGDDMRATLNRIAAEGDKIVLGKRDELMVAAMPGLRDHDAGVAAPDFVSAKPFFESALEIVGSAADRAPEGDPIGVYLRFAQLSTCRQWQARAGELGVGQASNNESREARVRGLALLKELHAAVPNNAAARSRALEFRNQLGIKPVDFNWP